jgi:hypothetical protein
MRVVVLLLAILALSAFVGCQSKPMVVTESQPGLEGIKVHGDWTVEVTNPDGTLAAKREFSNKLTPAGTALIAGLVSGDTTVQNHKIKIGWPWLYEGPNYAVFGCEEEYISNSGIIVNAKVLRTSGGVVGTQGEDYLSRVTWSGGCTVKFTQDTLGESIVLTHVYTFLELSPDLKHTADLFPASSGDYLTGRELDEPIEVFEGQLVAATVIMSFE